MGCLQYGLNHVAQVLLNTENKNDINIFNFFVMYLDSCYNI